jgi:hypothetical protein
MAKSINEINGWRCKSNIRGTNGKITKVSFRLSIKQEVEKLEKKKQEPKTAEMIIQESINESLTKFKSDNERINYINQPINKKKKSNPTQISIKSKYFAAKNRLISQKTLQRSTPKTNI